MKFLKISFISIISILIFQSQIYGINLRCDFKQILYGNDMNGVNCGWMGPYVCEVKNSQDERGESHSWISEVIIKNKDVVIINELSNYDRGSLTNKEKREKKKYKERVLIVESVVHHKIGLEGTKDEIDRYIFVINETVETYREREYVDLDYRQLYTLFFDNLSKKSILTKYKSYFVQQNRSNWTTSHYGECELE